MIAQCPSCEHEFPRQDRGRLFGGNPWRPTISACPECGARLQWVLWAWRSQLAAIAGIVIMLMPQTRVFGIGLVLCAGLLAFMGLRLRVVEPPPDSTGEA